MIIIPNQPFGLGDIIFTQTLVKYIADGRKIVWPVFPQFVAQLQRAYPDITWLNWEPRIIDHDRKEQYETTYEGESATVLPIRFANELLNVPYSQCMRAKYDLYRLDWKTWKDEAMWQKHGIEDSLFLKECNKAGALLGSHVLINEIFGSGGQLKINIPYRSAFNVIMMPSEEYSLFDWSVLMKNATEIHTVSTSIVYLLEMLELRAKEVHLYPRKPIEQDFRNIDYILQKHKYILHE